jgi:hypothetical protein
MLLSTIIQHGYYLFGGDELMWNFTRDTEDTKFHSTKQFSVLEYNRRIN